MASATVMPTRWSRRPWRRNEDGWKQAERDPQRHRGQLMADLYAKALESERKALWATCRLKGLAKDSPERQRIAELDRLIAEHNAGKAK